jgi:hypothetical protein
MLVRLGVTNHIFSSPFLEHQHKLDPQFMLSSKIEKGMDWGQKGRYKKNKRGQVDDAVNSIQDLYHLKFDGKV